MIEFSAQPSSSKYTYFVKKRLMVVNLFTKVLNVTKFCTLYISEINVGLKKENKRQSFSILI